MLFDKVPLLIGSGVIPRHFKEISRASTEKFIDMVSQPALTRAAAAAASRAACQPALAVVRSGPNCARACALHEEVPFTRRSGAGRVCVCARRAHNVVV